MQLREKVYDLIFEKDDSSSLANAVSLPVGVQPASSPDIVKNKSSSLDAPVRRSANKLVSDHSRFFVLLASLTGGAKKIPRKFLGYTSKARSGGDGAWDALSQAADAVKFPIFAIDNNRCVIVWNKAMESLTGVAAKEILTKGNYAYAVPFYGTRRPMLIDHVVIPPEIAKSLDMGAVTKSGETYTEALEEVLIRGQPMWMQGRATRIYDAEGRVTAAVQSIGVTSVENPASTASKAEETAEEVQTTETRETVGSKRAAGIASPLAGARHEESLHTALDHLMAREEKLLRNYEELTRITEQLIESERKVRAQELLQCVVSDAREGIVAFDRDLRYTLWNGFMEDLTGISAKRVLGKPANEIFPLFRVIGADHMLERALTGETAESSDVSFFAQVSSKQVWVKVIYSPLYDMNSEITGVIGIIQDTTARKVMEHSLQMTVVQAMESESKYRNIFNAKNIPLLIVNAATKAIVDLNDAVVRLYGWPKDEMLGMSLSDLQAEQLNAGEGGEVQSSCDLMQKHRKKDGSVFPVDISADYFILRGTSVMILAIRDLSSPQQVAESLRVANAKLNLMMSITRHDVLNKLTAVAVYNELLQKDYPEGHNKEMLQNQEKAILSIRSQIEFTRDYDDFGFREPQWQNACTLASRAFAQFAYSIQFSCDTGDLEIYADPLLERVFYNFFDNSFRHGEGLSRIQIFFRKSQKGLILYFEDDGSGVPPADKERIFSRGFGRNTGMGLFLAREILSITRIDLSETGEYRKGARFELRVPEGMYRFAKSPTSLPISEKNETNVSKPMKSFSGQDLPRNCGPGNRKRSRFLYQKSMSPIVVRKFGEQNRETS